MDKENHRSLGGEMMEDLSRFRYRNSKVHTDRDGTEYIYVYDAKFKCWVCLTIERWGEVCNEVLEEVYIRSRGTR